MDKLDINRGSDACLDLLPPLMLVSKQFAWYFGAHLQVYLRPVHNQQAQNENRGCLVSLGGCRGG